MSFYVGQGVVCINSTPRYPRPKRLRDQEQLPEVGRCYTIRELVPTRTRGYDEDGMRLVEIVNPLLEYNQPRGPSVTEEVAFRFSWFRPLVSASSDVEQVREAELCDACSRLTRRQVLTGSAAVAAGVVLPVRAVVSEAEEAFLSGLRHLPPMASDAERLGVFVLGCGEACDCCGYLRIDCAWNRIVRKLGDRFMVYDRHNKVIGEADPGFQPLPHNAEWVAMVEYAKANGLPHPYHWPKGSHAEWRLLHGDTLEPVREPAEMADA